MVEVEALDQDGRSLGRAEKVMTSWHRRGGKFVLEAVADWKKRDADEVVVVAARIEGKRVVLEHAGIRWRRGTELHATLSWDMTPKEPLPDE